MGPYGDERSSGDDLSERIVDTALMLAEEFGWRSVRLSDVAARLQISLADLAIRFRDLNAVADAWLERARLATLQPMPADFLDLPERRRLELLIGRWFDALAPHRQVTVQIFRTKLWPVHVHHWLPMAPELSRTVLWFMDAAGLEARGIRRPIEEVGLTGLFLAALAIWSADETEGQQRTKDFLARRLTDADALVTLAFGASPTARAAR